MSANTTRWRMVALLVVAAVLSVIGQKTHSRWIGWLSFVAFIAAVFVYVDWRRQVAARRRAGTVFDREAKTHETRTGPDE